MPDPIRTSKTTGIYGAPPGREAEVGGLPYYRASSLPGVTAVYSVWRFSDLEREWIAKGRANLVIGIVGMEPIPPISVQLRDDDSVQPFTPPDTEDLVNREVPAQGPPLPPTSTTGGTE